MINVSNKSKLKLKKGESMIRVGQAVKHVYTTPTTVVIKPQKGCVYRKIFATRQDAELCVSMHEANGEMASILENKT